MREDLVPVKFYGSMVFTYTMYNSIMGASFEVDLNNVSSNDKSIMGLGFHITPEMTVE